MTNSLVQIFWLITTLEPMKLYVTFLNYSYPQTLKYLFNIIYLSNSCEESMELFFLPPKYQLTIELASRDLSIYLFKFNEDYDKLDDYASF